jgi:CheY-like chemotaxis protein
MGQKITTRGDALRLLWIDDEPLMRRAIELASFDSGAFITTAASTSEARARMESATFDWIVCDYRLRLETAKHFVEELVARGQPVVVLTGDASTVDPRLSVPVVEKPVELSYLIAQLTAHRSPGG